MKRSTPSNPSGEQSPPEHVRLPMPPAKPLYQRLLSLALYGAAILGILLYRTEITGWLEQAGDVHPLLIVCVATLLALFPVIPYPLIGGILGATFGLQLGAVYTWIGSSAASILMFVLVRWLLYDWGQRLLARVSWMSRITAWFEKSAFMFILAVRLIPFIPSVIVNVYCAVSKVGFWPYAIASSLGKIPSMLMFAILGNQLLANPRSILVTLAVYGVFIGLVYIGYFKVYLRRQTN
ncbi:TVP38/TMEM64 family protein [Paenibacillus daejeonensis]|uniref:TVP38/TMEM64 family protein n=1 Tax=Paenibacillus daejeonensis TaxID=135193 RepID=UPI0003607E7A|nr:TVP38/TMEM64 family protein [Paenibacillus daejeonensis]